MERITGILVWLWTRLKTLAPWVAAGRSRVVEFGSYMRVSFVALVNSKAAWAAVIVIGLAGWWGGYLAGAAGKHRLRNVVSQAEITIRGQSNNISELQTANRKLRAQVAMMEKAAEATSAEAKATTAPPAPVVRRTVRSSRRKEAAAPKPFWPFQ